MHSQCSHHAVAIIVRLKMFSVYTILPPSTASVTPRVPYFFMRFIRLPRLRWHTDVSCIIHAPRFPLRLPCSHFVFTKIQSTSIQPAEVYHKRTQHCNGGADLVALWRWATLAWHNPRKRVVAQLTRDMSSLYSTSRHPHGVLSIGARVVACPKDLPTVSGDTVHEQQSTCDNLGIKLTFISKAPDC